MTRLERVELVGWQMFRALVPWTAMLLLILAAGRTLVDPRWLREFPMVPTGIGTAALALFAYAGRRIRVLEDRDRSRGP